MSDKQLKTLFQNFPFQINSGIPDSTLIRNIVADSRLIQEGDLFIATRGDHYDAHRFIPQAIKNGCSAIVGMEAGIRVDVPYIQVENSRKALAYISAAFYDFPARSVNMIGVTGTDGKTTTCFLIYEILKAAGFNVGMITTLSAVIGDTKLDTGFHVTTPDSPEVQKYLSLMVGEGVSHIILETTSHGWAQFRVDSCEFDIGVVTNITHEHLDEHESYENYVAAKARLFESLQFTRQKEFGNPNLAILNKDDQSYEVLKPLILNDCLTYGIEPTANVYSMNVKLNENFVEFTAHGINWNSEVICNLPGLYNISNCLAALSVTVDGLGIDPAVASQGILNLKGISGRLEEIEMGQLFTAIVDFAHTPNALKNVLETIRKFTSGRIIVILGSAGLRDREKRRLMAEISIERADYSIFTAEDPRTESLDVILEEMAEGAIRKKGQEGIEFSRIPDRRDAIRYGVSIAQAEDCVVACGKGHEQSMCFGEIEYPWDDRIAMRSALAEMLNIEGPEMPFLP